MATKNLARTVIEAGRTGSSKYARRRLRRLERREAKHFCYLAKNLIHEEDLGPKPVRLKRGWEFQQDDKIGPAMRWMMSKVGEVWDEVYSELSAKFRQRGLRCLMWWMFTCLDGWIWVRLIGGLPISSSTRTDSSRSSRSRSEIAGSRGDRNPTSGPVSGG